jgi:arsenite-transporting ATPase
VSRRLTAIELDAEAEYDRFKRSYEEELTGLFRAEAGGIGVDATFDREALERVMDLAPPGLDEVLAVTKAVELMEQGRYDLFILDTAPTGHLLRFLEAPELIEQWIKTLFSLLLKYRSVLWLPRLSQELVALSKRIKTFQQVLHDPLRTGLMVVSIPTELAYEETVDLVEGSRRLGLTVLAHFVNQVTPPSPCANCSMIRARELRVLRRFEQGNPYRGLTLVYRGTDVRGIEPLRRLGRELYRDIAERGQSDGG